MRDVNKIILIGRLGADPTPKETKTGNPMTTFPLATSRKENGQEETQWHRVVCWGKQAEHCAEYLKKGQAVFVEGSLRVRKFDGKDGIQRTSFEVLADNVSFLNGSRQTRTQTQGDSLEAEAGMAVASG